MINDAFLDVLNTVISDEVDSKKIHDIVINSIKAVDPYRVVIDTIRQENGELFVGDKRFSLSSYERIFLISVGKASYDMATAVVEVLGEQITKGVVVQKQSSSSEGEVLPVSFKIFRGGHPIPNDNSLEAARFIFELLARTSDADLVIFLISGGGSALLTDPDGDITLEDLQMLTEKLLESGTRIDEINTIRKHLDRVKGGGLAKAAYPATVITLILSDVVGNPIDMIASGPTVPDQTTYIEAMRVIERYQLTEKIPESILTHLKKGVSGKLPETPKKTDAVFERANAWIVGSNLHAAQAAVFAARDLGFNTLLLTTYLQGEAHQVGSILGSILRQIDATGQPLKRPACVVAGGETTVVVKGDGLGGRNLEVSLGAAREVSGLKNVVFISLATDGEDGPTDAAGAVINGETMQKARRKNLQPQKFLNNNDSYHFFLPLNALIKLGPTGTNVNDLFFLLAL